MKRTLFRGQKLGVVVLLGALILVFLIAPRVLFWAFVILGDPDKVKLRTYEYLSREWRDHSILENATGAVFAADAPWEIVPEVERGRLRRYDLARREWIPAGEATPRLIDPLGGLMASWDVYGGWLAYCTPIDEDYMDAMKAVICRVDTGEIVREIEGNYCQMRLSPSKKMIALIEDCGGVFEFHERGNHSRYERKGRLKVFEIATGKLLAEHGDFVRPRGIAWAPDEAGIAYVTYADQGVFTCQEKEVGHIQTPQAQKKMNEILGNSEQNVYIWNIARNETEHVGKGAAPDWNADGRLVFTSDRGACVYTPGEGLREWIPFHATFRWAGPHLLLASLNAGGRPPGIELLVLISTDNPARRCAIGQSYRSGCFSP